MEPPTDDRLAAWIAFLASPDAAPDALRPLELDGFLCGMIIAPDRISPDEWLEAIWGEEGSPPMELARAQTIFESVVGHYNDLILRMDDEETPFRPMFVGADGGIVPERFPFWLRGFLRAVAFDLDTWEDRLDRDEEFQLMSSPLFTAAEIELDENSPIEADEGFRRRTIELIPQVLPVLRRHVQSPAPPRSKRRGGPKDRRKMN